MIVYRIASLRYARDLSGRGAELYGGRWNPRGTPMIYAASSRALAYLELLVHVQADALPLGMALLSISIPDDSISEPPSLKADWYDDVRYTQGIGSSFAMSPPESGSAEISAKRSTTQSTSHLAMLVPSVIIPEEFNAIINPSHHRASEITIVDIGELRIDPRLTRRAHTAVSVAR